MCISVEYGMMDRGGSTIPRKKRSVKIEGSETGSLIHRRRENLEIYDRVGGGDGFASGMAYAFLAGRAPAEAVEYGATHGALAMTTPGDTSMVTLQEVERAMKASGARVIR